MLLVLALSWALASCACTREQPVQVPGERAADFQVPLPDGGQTSLAALARERPVLVWFTNLCDTCLDKGRRFERLRTKLGIQVVAVTDPTIGPAEVATARAATGMGFPAVLDAAGELGRQYQAPVSHDT